MSLSENRGMEVDERVTTAIDNAVAASRWRIMARFEQGETARRYRRLGDIRSAAATGLLDEMAREAGREARPSLERDRWRGPKGRARLE